VALCEAGGQVPGLFGGFRRESALELVRLRGLMMTLRSLLRAFLVVPLVAVSALAATAALPAGAGTAGLRLPQGVGEDRAGLAAGSATPIRCSGATSAPRPRRPVYAVAAGALPDGTPVIISDGLRQHNAGVAAGPTGLRSAYAHRYGVWSSRHHRRCGGGR
jgi:hypothetical protein